MKPRLPIRTPVLAALTVLAVAVGVNARPSPEPDATADLRRDLSWIVRSSGWRAAQWGILAVSLDTGDTLFAMSPDQPMVPASNVKLLTTAAALHHLGPDFRFPTYALAVGPVVDGRLEGDLVLYGTGDPGISGRFYDSRSTVWEELARQLARAGIHTVGGDVVGDGSFFQGPLVAPQWDLRDLNEAFAAPAAALSFNENVVTLRIEPAAQDGGEPRVHTIPEGAQIRLLNQARTGPGRLAIQREDLTRPIVITGFIPPWSRDVWRRLTVSRPASYATHYFARVLAEEGIQVDGTVRTSSSAERSKVTGARVWAPSRNGAAPRVVARHLSPPLVEYLEVVNKESHNFMAEMTLKALGRIVGGEGSYERGARVVERFLEEEVGVPAGSFEIQDGSGLSPTNRATPGTFVALLRHMAASPGWETFWATLPEAGNRRELGRMYRTAAARNLRAKTGTIEGVSALSGVVHTANGERVAFSILGNHLPSVWAAKSRVEDRIGARLASFRRPFTPPVSESDTPGGAAADATAVGAALPDPDAIGVAEEPADPPGDSGSVELPR